MGQIKNAALESFPNRKNKMGLLLSAEGPFLDKQKRQASQLAFLHVLSDRTLNLIGTEASCTDVDMARGTIHDGLHALYVGLPHSVGTSVGVGDLDAERNTLAANIALCQLLHLQS